MPSESSQSGSAYLFEEIEVTWSQVRKFTPPPTAGHQSQFGAGVALRGDLAMIGSPRRDAAIDIDRGAVHVYRRTTTGSWLLTDEFQTFFNNRSYLGQNIAVSGTTPSSAPTATAPRTEGRATPFAWAATS